MAAVDFPQEYIFALWFILVVYFWEDWGGNRFRFDLISILRREAKVIKLEFFKLFGLFQLFEALKLIELTIKGNGCGLLEECGKGNFLEKLKTTLDRRGYFLEEHLVALSVLLLIVVSVLNLVEEGEILSQGLF